MAERNITSLTLNTLWIGLVIMGMLTFYILLANSEGRGEIFDGYPEVEKLNLNFTNIYTNGELVDTANINSNLTSTYNPELAISAADQSGNAIAVNLQDIITVGWSQFMVILGFMFGSNVMVVISGLIISAIAYLATAYIIKSIRTGDL